MVSVRGVTVRGRSLSSEHTAQHGQSLNVAHVTVVIQTGTFNTQTFIPSSGFVPRKASLHRCVTKTHRVSSRWRPNGCLAQGVSVSGSESGLRS